MDYPDIYYYPEWGQLNEKHDGGKYECYEYSDHNGKVLYPYMIRRIAVEKELYDLITPWGFNGPIVVEVKPDGNRKDLIKNFDCEFQRKCEKEHIVSEFIRFSPWLKNADDFKSIYELQYNNYTLAIDLETKDFFKDEFSSGCRNLVRKAIKDKIKIEYDFTGKSLEEFIILYRKMEKKNKVSEFYKFPDNYFYQTFDYLKDKVFIINAVLDGKTISSSMFMVADSFVHYHLCGNDPEFLKYNANRLILYEACKWALKNRKMKLHLGGAYEENLFYFKKQFTKHGFYDFYRGKKIRLSDEYSWLVDLTNTENSGYFPKYREVL